MRSLSFLFALLGMLLGGSAFAQTAAAPPAPPPVDPENVWHLDLTTGGRVSIQLRPDVAPGHVERIKTLTRQGFYDGLVFHRVIEGFMAQGGDPTATGMGGSELPDIPAEIHGLPHVRGSVAMARGQDRNSANSQFYIMFVPRLAMDREYTVFGRVISGMNFVDTIERGEPPLAPTRIVRASIGSDNVPPLPAETLRAAAQAPAAPAPSDPTAPTTGTFSLVPGAAPPAAPPAAVPPAAAPPAGAPPAAVPAEVAPAPAPPVEAEPAPQPEAEPAAPTDQPSIEDAPEPAAAEPEAEAPNRA